MTAVSENSLFRMKTDCFHAELFCPAQNAYPRKVLICFTGSDGMSTPQNVTHFPWISCHVSIRVLWIPKAEIEEDNRWERNLL